MAPLITRLVQTVIPGPQQIGTCLVCAAPVHTDDAAVRLHGGGYVHTECTTYRMRQRNVRTVGRDSRNGHEDFTGE